MLSVVPTSEKQLAKLQDTWYTLKPSCKSCLSNTRIVHSMGRRSGDNNADSAGVGEGFRWSWDEIKSLFSRNSNSGAPQREAGVGASGHGSGGRTSLFRWSNDTPLFRWSFEDLKEKVRSFGSSSGHASNKKRKRQRKGNNNNGAAGLATNPGGAAAAAPAPTKAMTRREKKTMREKRRRDKVKKLMDSLGEHLGIPSNGNGVDDARNSRVSILTRAIDEIREKKGLPPREQDPNSLKSDLELMEDDDLDVIMDIDENRGINGPSI